MLPTVPVDYTVNEGKSLWYISGTFRDERSKQVAAAFEEAATSSGLDVRVLDGQGSVEEWAKLVDEAVAAGADGIHLAGIDPSLIAASVEEADEAGIPVTLTSALPSPYSELLHGVEINVSGDMAADMRVMIDYILAESDCQGTIIMFATSLTTSARGKLAGTGGRSLWLWSWTFF